MITRLSGMTSQTRRMVDTYRDIAYSSLMFASRTTRSYFSRYDFTVAASSSTDEGAGSWPTF